jgi:parvulin-like peptidyl-prolyl isomerase
MSALSNIRNSLSSSGSSIIVGLLIFGLVATFGGFLGDGNIASRDSILSVNGKEISSGEFAIEYGRLDSQLSQSDQDIPDEILENIVKESIILKELFSQSAKKIGLNIDDKKLNQIIINDPSFYADGTFDVDLFKGFLSRLGMNPENFKEYVKSKYLSLNIQNVIDEGVIFNLDDVRKFISSNNQTRDITFSRISLVEESLKEDLKEEEALDFYRENRFLYISPLNFTYRILEFDRDSFTSSVSISDEEILKEQDALDKNYLPQKKVSHIEISYDENNKEERLNLAENILSELNNNVTSFNEAVTNYSTDLSTKNNSGDLGYTDGSMFPDEFENELKIIDPNEISKIIDLTTSFHIIKYTEEKNINLSREEIREKIFFTKTSDKLEEALNFIEENIYISSLEEISNEFNLNLINILNEDENKLLSKFTELDLNELREGELYGPYELEDKYFLIGIDKITDQDFKAFEQVEDQITEELKLAKASKKISSLVKSDIEDLSLNSNKFNSYSEVKRDNFLLPNEVTKKLFSYDLLENEIFSVYLENGDAYVVKLNKINENKGVITSKDLEEGKNYLASVYKNIIRDSFINSLRENSNIN